MKPYDHKKIEKKWQAYWEKKEINQAEDNSPKPTFYALIEFPFPSGDGMHTGHLRSNTAMDIIARKRRAEGFNVLYPIGWDAFGLPTENYAIKTGLHPKIVTKKNTDTFRKQLKSAGFSFDWSREVNTSDPAYYKWTQWIFLQMHKHGLAYKKKMLINWCPKDKIGLANEEVVDGKCDRCGSVVEKREKEQWMLAITKYAERLDKDLDTVDYLEKIKIQQRNWIGASEGAEIDFNVRLTQNNPSQARPRLTPAQNYSDSGVTEKITIFTTRPDTLFGVTYLVLAPEHPWVTRATDQNHDVLLNKEEVKQYVETAKNRPMIERTAEGKEKTGVEVKGVVAINPATKEEIPIFVADYVLGDYGTGAVMAVPAHDERDFHFAVKHALPSKEVVEPHYIQTTEPGKVKEGLPIDNRNAIIAIVKHWSEDKYMALKWKKVAWGTFVTGGIEQGQTAAEAGAMEIKEETGYLNPRFIKELGVAHGTFYHVPKQVNRCAHAHVLYFELQNGDRTAVDESEQQIHDLLWLTTSELKTFLTPETHHHALRWLTKTQGPYSGEGFLKNSGQYDGVSSQEARKKIVDMVGGRWVKTYKLRDWIFSRQRYWGEPIPMVHCSQCEKNNPDTNGWIPVPEKELPIKLPDVKNYVPSDTGESPLAAISEWVNTRCPVCKGPARRETDTMPNWAGSSWYFLRYIDPKNKKSLAEAAKLKYWMPVDWYNGGMEHTTLHLLYSRFWNKFLFDIGIVPTSEPYQKRTSHGLILAADGEKMSKSRGNVVNPDAIIETVGADALRLYEMFMGPFDQAVAWNLDGVVGPRRFLERVWKLQEKVEKKNEQLDSVIHKSIKKISADIEAMQFNTAVSALMILLNDMEKAENLSSEQYGLFLKLLSPFAPHITEELWAEIGNTASIHLQPWPIADETRISTEEVTIIVQVNGKIRGEFKAEPGIPEEMAKNKAFSIESVQKWAKIEDIKKIIYVKDRLINIVV